MSCNTRTLHFINGESACRMAPWSVRSVCSRANAAPLMPGAVCLRLPVPGRFGKRGMRWGGVGGGKGMRPKRSPRYSISGLKRWGPRFWLPATPFRTRPAGGLLKSAVFTTTTMQYATAMMAARSFAGPIVCWSPNGKNFLPPKRLNRSIYKFKKEYIHGRIHIGFWPRPFIRKRR